MRLRFVALQALAHPVVDLLLISAILHVDEVANDEPADIAQTQLARDFISCLQVGLQDCFLDIATAFVASGIYVHRNQRLGLIDHDVAAALQPDLTMKGIVDLFLHAEGFKDWRGAVIGFHSLFRAA